jgi:hypothetical protein
MRCNCTLVLVRTFGKPAPLRRPQTLLGDDEVRKAVEATVIPLEASEPRRLKTLPSHAGLMHAMSYCLQLRPPLISFTTSMLCTQTLF